MLNLTTLGAARTTPDGLQSKRLALVAYLAMARPRGAQRRDTLLALLWPELDQSRARSALRQAVHAIRKTAGQDVIASLGTELVELNTGVISCDALAIEAARSSGEHARVLELYYGEFLAGLHLSDAPAFEEWRATESRSLAAMALESAWMAADGALAAGAATQAARFATRALEISPFNEDVLQRAMRVMAAAGAPSAALAEHTRFAARLREEMRVDVTTATTALAAELRAATPVSHVIRVNAPVREAARAELVIHQPPAGRFPRLWTAWRGIVIAGVVLLASAADMTLDPRRIEVSPIVGESQGEELEALAGAATMAARAAIAELQNVRVVAESPRATRGAGTLVRGRIRLDRDTIELRGEVLDRNDGSIARTAVVRVARRDSASLAATFSDRIRTSVATALYPGWGNGLSQPASFASYQRFAAGMLAIKAEDHDRALLAFQRAFDADSSFTAAGLMVAAELLQLGRFAAADSIARSIETHDLAGKAVDEALLGWVRASLRGDRVGARAAMQRIVALEPNAALAWLQLAIDNLETGRPKEALAALDRLSGSDDGDAGWLSLWARKIEALHSLGKHTEELGVAREGLRQHPDMETLKVYELRTLGALGRTDEIERLLDLLPSRAERSISATRQAAQELAAHGRPDDARTVLTRLEHLETGGRLSSARGHYLRGEYEEALAIYDSVRRANPSCLDCVGVVGAIAARQGNREFAQRYARTLAATDTLARPYLFGRHLLWQARIANLLGERERATRTLVDAFAAGTRLAAMTHADPDLAGLAPDSLYREFTRAGDQPSPVRLGRNR